MVVTLRSTYGILILTALTVLLIWTCTSPAAISVSKARLNYDVQERFAAGRTPDRLLFQYGQNSDNALDIVVPLDPSGSREIAKAHNFYMSRGSTVEFNLETLIEFRLYEIDDDLEDHGELIYPLQWMSVCTSKHHIRGGSPINKDGDAINITTAGRSDPNDFYNVFLKRCKTNPLDITFKTPGGPLAGSCDDFEMGGSNDPFRGQNINSARFYPACMLDGRFTLDASSSFTWNLLVNTYDDFSISYVDRYFTDSIRPTFFVVDRNITKYYVEMQADVDNALVASGNGGNEPLRYTWTMPTVEGIWQDNFASDIDIDYVRFYWTDRGRRHPIVLEPRLGNPPHEVQINFGSVCRNVDTQGYLRTNDCNIFSPFTPAAPKNDLDNRITWRLAVFYDDRDYLMGGLWGQPVIMEFGIRASN